MKAYLAAPTSRAIRALVVREGLSVIISRGQIKRLMPGIPWVFDNGAFVDWRAEKPFDEAAWRADIETIRGMEHQPECMVLPDIVAGGSESLEFSARFLREFSMSWPEARWLVAVQDGMEECPVCTFLLHPAVRGLFVGGTVEWKERTAAAWVKLAHRYGKICHVGRVGTARKVAWAAGTDCDSIDSAVPLFSQDNMRCWLAGIYKANHQLRLEVIG